MRHLLIHDYFRVNHDMAWDTTSMDLPPLRAMTESILSEFNDV